MFVNATTLDPCCCCCCCRLIARWKWLFQLPSSRLASNALDCNLRALWRRAVMCRAFSELYRQHQMTKSSSEFTLRLWDVTVEYYMDFYAELIPYISSLSSSTVSYFFILGTLSAVTFTIQFIAIRTEPMLNLSGTRHAVQIGRWPKFSKRPKNFLSFSLSLEWVNISQVFPKTAKTVS